MDCLSIYIDSIRLCRVMQGGNMKTVNLYRVSMIHQRTNEKVSLEVWADNVDEATNKCNFLFDCEGQYRWAGSGPVHDERGKIPSKEIKE